MPTHIQTAKNLLDQGDCTLVIVNGDRHIKMHRRGVIDLVSVLDESAELLKGAYVADKIIGKAAAALMIEGGVRQVYTRVITDEALAMFAEADIPVSYGERVPMVSNRNKTGRCPIDTLCADIKDRAGIIAAIKNFLRQSQA